MSVLSSAGLGSLAKVTFIWSQLLLCTLCHVMEEAPASSPPKDFVLFSLVCFSIFAEFVWGCHINKLTSAQVAVGSVVVLLRVLVTFLGFLVLL